MAGNSWGDQEGRVNERVTALPAAEIGSRGVATNVESPPNPVRGAQPFQSPPLRLQSSQHQSEYLVKRLAETPDHNLFNHVKFHLIHDQLRRHFAQPPRVLDVGCGLQVARRYLQALYPGIEYFGVDYEVAFAPDAVVDLNGDDALREPMRWAPDVVMLLDVLEHLHDNKPSLSQVIADIARQLPRRCLVILTLPQLYRLDRFKLAHLHYPEHKIRLEQHEWRALLEEHLDIIDVQGLGYLSVLPYLPMLSKHYRADNQLGELFQHLRAHTFEREVFKPVDLWLSRKLGRLARLKVWSNDVLFVARPRC